MHGFWAFDWADNYVIPVTTTLQANGATEVTVSPHTPPVYQFTVNARVMGVNLFSELDAPGTAHKWRSALPGECMKSCRSTQRVVCLCQLWGVWLYPHAVRRQ